MKRTSVLALLGLACLMAMPKVAEARYRGGMNLYQYARSSPTVYVDFNGAQASRPATNQATRPGPSRTMPADPLPGTEGRWEVNLKKEPIVGKSKEWPLSQPEVYLENGAAGKVRVYTNAWLRYSTDPNRELFGQTVLEFRLHRKGSYKKGDCRWLQFMHRETNSGRRAYSTKYAFQGYGIKYRHVDSDHPTDPFYDANQGAGNWSDVEATLLDKPNVFPGYLGANQFEKAIYDAILICCKKPRYLVHWEWHAVSGKRDSEWDYEKTGHFNVSGAPLPQSRLPAWASTPTFLSGYRDAALSREQPRYNNPVPRESWTVRTETRAASGPSTRP